MKRISLLLATSMVIAAASQAAKVGIVDSGLDYQHPELQSKIWNNRAERNNDRDDDDNQKIDDFRGWNFAADSNKTFDYSKLISLTPELRRGMEIMGAASNGDAPTEAEIEELKGFVEADPNYAADLTAFGTQAHGTHVGGIVADGNPHVKLGSMVILQANVRDRIREDTIFRGIRWN